MVDHVAGQVMLIVGACVQRGTRALCRNEDAAGLPNLN
jgi:hypothetical protein